MALSVYLVGQYNPMKEGLGGIEVYLKSLYTELKKNNINVNVIGWSDKNEGHPDFTPIVKTSSIRGAVFSFHLLMKAPFLKIPADAVIHVQRPDHVIPFLFKKNRVILSLHGAHIKNVRLKKGYMLYKLYELVQGIAFKKAEHVLCVSEEDKTYFTEKYPFLQGKIQHVCVGVDSIFRPMDRKRCRKKWNLQAKEKILLYVGRLEKEKQVDKIINAFRNTAHTLVIAGSGSEEDNLKRISPPNVIFLGNVPHSRLPELFNCADATALMSMHEGMPTVLLESLSCGVPVLAPAVGGIIEIIDNGKIGFLATEKDIAEKFEQLRGMKKACLIAAEKYSWHNVVKEIIKVYNQ